MNRDLLEAPFPPEAIRQREGNFGHLIDYIEGHSVIQRLNDALDGSWSFEVVEHHVIKDLDEIVVLGKLSTHGLVKSQFGASTIKRTRDSGEIICMADAFKAAATDALKKCATLLGVGLDLYSGSEPAPARNPANARSQPHKNNGRGSRPPEPRQTDGTGRLTAKQHSYLIRLAGGRGLTRQQLNDHCVQAYGAGLDFIKRKEASALIETLNAGMLPPGPATHAPAHLN